MNENEFYYDSKEEAVKGENLEHNIKVFLEVYHSIIPHKEIDQDFKTELINGKFHYHTENIQIEEITESKKHFH